MGMGKFGGRKAVAYDVFVYGGSSCGQGSNMCEATGSGGSAGLVSPLEAGQGVSLIGLFVMLARSALWVSCAGFC